MARLTGISPQFVQNTILIDAGIFRATFDHLGFDQTYRDRVDFKYHESGHMA